MHKMECNQLVEIRPRSKNPLKPTASVVVNGV